MTMVQCSSSQVDADVKVSLAMQKGKDPPATHSRNLLKRPVRFESIQIRHYERILGDHPSCSAGAPIGIGWNYLLEEHLTVEEFEEQHRTDCRPLPLDKEQRHDLLLAWGVKTNELASSVRRNLKAKHQRRRTFVNSTTRYDRWEEAVETASRKLKKSLQWTSVFSSDSAVSRRAALSTSEKRPIRTGSVKRAESKQLDHSASSISTTTTPIPKAPSQVMLSTNFDKTDAAKEPSVSNAQRPLRPPASPHKTMILKHPDDSSSRDSFPKIVLDSTGMFDVSGGSKSTSSKCYGMDETEDLVSIFDDSSSSSTEYTDSEEENNYLSVPKTVASSAIR